MLITSAVISPRPRPGGGAVEFQFFPSPARRRRLGLRCEKGEVLCFAADTPSGQVAELCRVTLAGRLVRPIRLIVSLAGPADRVEGGRTDLAVQDDLIGSMAVPDKGNGWGWPAAGVAARITLAESGRTQFLRRKTSSAKLLRDAGVER